jgi:hypothetical protein
MHGVSASIHYATNLSKGKWYLLQQRCKSGPALLHPFCNPTPRLHHGMPWVQRAVCHACQTFMLRLYQRCGYTNRGAADRHTWIMNCLVIR